MKIKIALAQIDVKWADPDTNVAAARAMVAGAALQSADLIVLPELWGSGYDLGHAADYATSVDGGVFAEMAALARQHSVYLTGSLLERSQGRVYNTCALFGPRGLAGWYRKLHRFRLMDEDRYLSPGAAPTLLDDLPWGATGLAICYDLRFPELFRAYAVAGAQVILLPAQWPSDRIDHWRTLVRARAIENQCVMVACNRVGADPNNSFGGASAVVGPWGDVLAEGGDEPGLFLAEVDIGAVADARQRIPVLSDRRPDCYGL